MTLRISAGGMAAVIAALMTATVVLAQDQGAPAAQGSDRWHEPEERISMGEIFFMQRHPTTHKMEWFGSMIIWSLIGLSAVSVGLMGARAWESREELIVPKTLVGRADALLKDGRVSEFMDFLRVDASDLAALLTLALSRKGSSEEETTAAIEEAADSRVARRLRRLEPLNIIGNVAPMIGLFGTVYGMILVFRAIVAAGGTPDPTNLASGIGTKLVGTFWGLIVAIPALAAYAFLRNRVEGLSAAALDEAKRLVRYVNPAEAKR